ncbi:ABC transporter substrate-binding protein [Aquabacterium sp. OR-4]|uniref:ABC transporter substrate-binding protein n=1 Tax=Aquabacterium sp. OR-4 TaxID=2978127 RepID=UPI0021B1B510|nr:ABC transporter substrate-binding protein [Aquabacterium sp. OR-4]MDT7835375.1 ABC transporter substrate-binding protein [Aquabacterium sp. OR-4]
MTSARRSFVIQATAVVLAATAFSSAALAQKKYDTGADDKEIKIGNIMPYSGPASAYGVIGKAMGAYFDMVNAQGGINGRKVKFITVDDGYNPAKTVEQARKLVEEEEVLLVFAPLGTPPNSAIHKYMNQKKVPQLFVATGATKWGDPKNFPWTMGWQPAYTGEGRIYAQHLMETMPNAKVAILYQNDDYGKDYLKGFEEGLGAKGSMVVSKVSYEVTDPTIDSQILTLKNSGANVFFNITTPKFAAQAIKKIPEVGWKLDAHYLNSVSASVGSVLKPAGLDNAVGLITTQYLKDPTDPAWANDADFKAWTDWMKKYYPGGDLSNAFNVTAWTHALTMAQVLRQCGDNLTRENVMRQAANLNMQNVPMLLPGVEIKTGPDDFYPVEKEQLSKFDGKTWVRFGKVYGK